MFRVKYGYTYKETELDEYINFKSKKEAEEYIEEKLFPYYDEFLLYVELWDVDNDKLIKKNTYNYV